MTGPVHSGKTTLLKRAISLLEEKNCEIDGYLSEAVKESTESAGYDLIDLEDRSCHPFIRTRGREEWQRIGSFFFLPEALAMAQKIIRRNDRSDLRVVDEVGPLELRGKGVWPALEELLEIRGQNVLLVVRESLLEEFARKARRDDLAVYEMEPAGEPGRLAEYLIEDLEKEKKRESP